MNQTETRVLSSSTVAAVVAVLAVSLTPTFLPWPASALWMFIAFAMVHATAIITASMLRRNAIQLGESPEDVRWTGPYLLSIPTPRLHALTVVAVALASCVFSFSADLLNRALRPSVDRLLGTPEWFFFAVGLLVTLVAVGYLLAFIVTAVFTITRRRLAAKAAASE